MTGAEVKKWAGHVIAVVLMILFVISMFFFNSAADPNVDDPTEHRGR